MKVSVRAGQQVHDVTVERNDGRYIVEVDAVRHVVDALKLEGDFYSIVTAGRSYEVSVEAGGDVYQVRHGAAEQCVTVTDPSRQARDAQETVEGPQRLLSVMPGKVVRVLVEEGDSVEAGQGVLVIEAMKMENEISAGKGGKVISIAISPGQAVEGGALLLVID